MMETKQTTGKSRIRAKVRCFITWNRAKVRCFITHFLAGGGAHNRGYHALRWEMILHGSAGGMGKYAVLSVLPDKMLVFCMNTMIHCTPLWACLLSLWTGVVSVFTASSDKIRCTCTINVSYAKYVQYANICNSMHILHILPVSLYC